MMRWLYAVIVAAVVAAAGRAVAAAVVGVVAQFEVHFVDVRAEMETFAELLG